MALSSHCVSCRILGIVILCARRIHKEGTASNVMAFTHTVDSQAETFHLGVCQRKILATTTTSVSFQVKVYKLE